MNNSPDNNHEAFVDPLSQLRYEQLVDALIDSIQVVILNPANSEYIFDEILVDTATNQRLDAETLICSNCYLVTPQQLGREVVLVTIIRDANLHVNVEYAMSFCKQGRRIEEFRMNPINKTVENLHLTTHIDTLGRRFNGLSHTTLSPNNDGDIGKLTLLKLQYCNLNEPISRADALLS